MPTYGYQCTQCDNQFEIVQRITEDPLSKCDKCGGELRKKIFPVGIAFKGSGFYVNDYSSKKPSTSASTTETPKAAETSTPEAKSAESTPAPTPVATTTEAAKPAPVSKS